VLDGEVLIVCSSEAYTDMGSHTRPITRYFQTGRPQVRFTYGTPSARTTPLASSRQRLELIKTVIEAEHTHLSTRIAALILLLYGIPVRRISELTLDDVEATAEQTTIRIGPLPAPIPEPLPPSSTSTSPTAATTKRWTTEPSGCSPAPAPGTTSPNKHSCSDYAASG
jgi:hypothetical protein